MKLPEDSLPLYYKSLEMLGFEPLESQAIVLKGMAEFVVKRRPGDVMIIRGYAGTGKTSITSSMVNAMKALGYKFVLLAPTGRAAKVISNYSSQPASTIHKRLFRGNFLSPESSGQMYMARNNEVDTLFIVDEASMIADTPSPGLLTSLVRYVSSGKGCNLMFIGDGAQLPPVGQTDSPAMNPQYLRSLGLDTFCMELNKTVRQAAQSGILYNATSVRMSMAKTPIPLPTLYASKFADVEAMTSEYLADEVATSYSLVGQDATIMITRSNFRANIINRGIRGMVLYAEDELQRDERLVVVRNNYFWGKKEGGLGFLANGEIVRVDYVYGTESRYGHRFADVELYLPVSDRTIDAKIMLDCLMTDEAMLSREELSKLYSAILAEKMEEGMDAAKAAVELRNDSYFNALQVKYAYCLTCHKAQGGQWKHVYVDLGGIKPEGLELDFYRWLYTAITRATDKLFLVNSSLPVK